MIKVDVSNIEVDDADKETKRNRKPGGGRKPSKPGYNPKSILQEQVEAAMVLYCSDNHPSLQAIADELDLNPIKVRKLLITAGVYDSATADQVQRVFMAHRNTGLSYTEAVTATMCELNLSKASVTSYLPYEKGLYFPEDTDSKNLSVSAERIRRMRKRRKVLEKLLEEWSVQNEHSKETLWEAVVEFQGYKFHTYSGLPYSYKLKKRRDGEYSRELFIDRRENSKSLAWSSVLLAFGNILKAGHMNDECKPLADYSKIMVDRPKALGDIRGVTYIYGIFYQFGLIDVPDDVKEKMEGKSSENYNDE